MFTGVKTNGVPNGGDTMPNVSSLTRWLKSISLWKKSSLWGHRPTLVPTNPRRRAISQAWEAPVVQFSLCHHPAHHQSCGSDGRAAKGDKEQTPLAFV